MDSKVKLSKAAKILGISRRCAQRMVYDGTMPVTRSDTGRVFVLTSWLETQMKPPVIGACPTCGRSIKQ